MNWPEVLERPPQSHSEQINMTCTLIIRDCRTRQGTLDPMIGRVNYVNGVESSA